MPIEEYPQTVPNLTAATSNLFDLIQSRSIALYSDAAMRLAVSRAREKGNAGIVLTKVARDIIAAQPIIDDNPFVFAGSLRGRRHKSARDDGPPCFNSWSERKAELDAALPRKMPHWTLHDLRRTARSLLARAGVANHIAERVLGHAIAGIEGVYNRHDHVAEKAEALDALARLIEQIVNPPARSNVVAIGSRDE